jgi:hypothetical protein
VSPQSKNRIKKTSDFLEVFLGEHEKYIPHTLEFDILTIAHPEFSEFGRELYSDIPPVPWFDIVSIDTRSSLITLGISVEVSIFLYPGNVFFIESIFHVVCSSARIEDIDSESELMLAISRRCTEGIGTPTEVPESLLIQSTPIATDDYERLTKCLSEVSPHSIECSIGILPEVGVTSCLLDTTPRKSYEVRWFIVFISERDGLRDESCE